MATLVNSTKHLREKYLQLYTNSTTEHNREEYFPTACFEAGSFPYSKTNKNTRKKY